MIDPEHGIDEQRWTQPLAAIPPFDLSRIGRAAIVSPHPDDEVLALGGSIELLERAQVPTSLIAITDGEASHPGVRDLAAIRASERAAALRCLHVAPTVTRLGIADGAVNDEADLEARLEPLVANVTHVFAPLDFDGHPDHDATGRVAAEVARKLGKTLVRFAVWAWHWARPDQLPLADARTIELPAEVRRDKRRAIAAYRSQIAAFEGTQILFPGMLAHFARSFEVVFV